MGALAAVAVLVLIVIVMRRVTASADGDGAGSSPTRVLLVGDSILNQTAPALRRKLPDLDLRNEAVNGSGLLTPDVADWPRRLDDLLGAKEFDVIVVLFVGNYTRSNYWVTEDGRTVTDKTSDAFFDAWAGQADRLAARAVDSGAEVLWVLPPPMVRARNQEVVDGLRRIYRSLAGGHGAVHLVDSYDALATDDGDYRRFGQDRFGGPAALRARDGVHLTQAGAGRLAGLLSDAIAEHG